MFVLKQKKAFFFIDSFYVLTKKKQTIDKNEHRKEGLMMFMTENNKKHKKWDNIMLYAINGQFSVFFTLKSSKSSSMEKIVIRIPQCILEKNESKFIFKLRNQKDIYHFQLTNETEYKEWIEYIEIELEKSSNLINLKNNKNPSKNYNLTFSHGKTRTQSKSVLENLFNQDDKEKDNLNLSQKRPISNPKIQTNFDHLPTVSPRTRSATSRSNETSPRSFNTDVDFGPKLIFDSKSNNNSERNSNETKIPLSSDQNSSEKNFDNKDFLDSYLELDPKFDYTNINNIENNNTSSNDFDLDDLGKKDTKLKPPNLNESQQITKQQANQMGISPRRPTYTVSTSENKIQYEPKTARVSSVNFKSSPFGGDSAFPGIPIKTQDQLLTKKKFKEKDQCSAFDLDNNVWKKAIIAKVESNNYFVVEFRESKKMQKTHIDLIKKEK